MRILLTCPPMIGLIDEFRDEFVNRNIELVVPQFVQVMREQDLIDIVPTCDGWIIGDDPATASVLLAGARGRLTAAVKWGIGVDNVDFAAAKAANIKITNTPDVFGNEVADLAMSYVIALARETFSIDRAVRKGEWPKPAGISLKDRVAGLVGFGDIGRQIGRRLEVSGMQQVIYDPAVAAATSWPDRLGELDFLIFACALTKSNWHMFNADILPLLKSGLRVVNVARGPLIDEAALITGLNSGVIHSAALDVMEVEPLPMASPLREFSRCIFGSHNASNTLDAVRRTSRQAMRTLFGYLGADDA